MKATKKSNLKVDGLQGHHRKQQKKGFVKAYLVISTDLKCIGEVRIYTFGETGHSVCFWWSAPGSTYNNGSFQGHYCSHADVVSVALDRAGYNVDLPGGRGEDYIIEALEAIAEAEGFPGSKVFTTHP